MTCTIAVFYLMIGSATFAGSALYIYFQNQNDVLKKKLASLNNALTNLQSERAILKKKVDNMFMDNATQSAELEKLKKILNQQEDTIVLLENDNQHLTKEYLLLENHIQNV